jgi:hypothetical protein
MDRHSGTTSFFEGRKPVADKRVLEMAEKIKADRKAAKATQARKK